MEQVGVSPRRLSSNCTKVEKKESHLFNVLMLFTSESLASGSGLVSFYKTTRYCQRAYFLHTQLQPAHIQTWKTPSSPSVISLFPLAGNVRGV